MAPERDDHDLVAGGAQRGHLGAELGDGGLVDARRASSVIDDVPILARRSITTRRRAHAVVGLVVERERADAHEVALAGAGPGQGLVDAERLAAGRWT